MPRVQPITTNFTAGEFSPRLRGRVDLDKYNASAELLENCVVLRHGGATIRPSRDYLGEIKVSTETARIVPFVYSRVDAYVLELGHQRLRVWKNGALVEASPGVPYELTTPWTQAQLAALDYSQGGDTLIVTHPDVPTQRVMRFADALWRCEAAPFAPGALDEIGHRSATISLTISATTVGAGRTITASAGFFLAADVGRTVTWGAGSALITAFGSATSVTATVTAAFSGAAAAANAWLLEGTPQATCTPSAKDPLGAACTLTLGASGWRSTDVGRFVEINGGLVELVGFTSDTIVSGTIRRVLTGTTADPADAWVLKGALWNAIDGYPSTCTLIEQRLWLGGTRKYPQGLWGSRSGLYFDFTPGVDDDSAVYKVIASDDTNLIQFLANTGQLVVLTYGGEFDVRGGIEKPVTQLNARITMRSRWGCDTSRPEQVGKDTVFAQRGGTALRVIVKGELDGFETRDISVFSEHLLADGIRCMAWEQTPEQVLWIATNAGRLLAVTYSDEQTTVAFCSGNAAGVVEWLCTVPDGAIDATYALTRYTISGATKRYVERLNWSAPPGQDARLQASVGTPTAAWTGFGHLALQTVCLLADGIYLGEAVVSPSGQITLPRPALTLSAGLPYAARIKLPAPEVGTGTGTAQGQVQSTHRVWLRLLNTIGCKVNGKALAFRRLDQQILDAPVPPFTGVKEVSDYGWASGESPLEISQPQPYPWTVLAVVRGFTVNAG